jgi:hypothetical protein
MAERTLTPLMERAAPDPIIIRFKMALHMKAPELQAAFVSQPHSFIRMSAMVEACLDVARGQVDDYVLSKSRMATANAVHYAFAKDILVEDYGLHVSPRQRILGDLTRLMCVDASTVRHLKEIKSTLGRGAFIQYCKDAEIKL